MPCFNCIADADIAIDAAWASIRTLSAENKPITVNMLLSDIYHSVYAVENYLNAQLQPNIDMLDVLPVKARLDEVRKMHKRLKAFEELMEKMKIAWK